ncbi:MAG: hypothetical protein IJB86_01695 [Clostridia bacterium]|nr:hypothetical protein [Clostridia bacterium]
MIKGVNRQVVEITQTDCEYFERILFFVKPEFASVSEGKLRERAGMMSSSNDRPPATRIRKNKLIQAACLGASAIIGAGAYALAAFLI